MNMSIAQAGQHNKKPRFLEAFWELKILLWGLLWVALVYAVAYAVSYTGGLN